MDNMKFKFAFIINLTLNRSPIGEGLEDFNFLLLLDKGRG
jgi:hypothetical protein